MKEIKIKDSTIITLLNSKDELINEGRALTKEIEDLEKKIIENNEVEKKYTESVTPTLLLEEGKELEKNIKKMVARLEKIGDEIMNLKIAAIPKEIHDLHYKLREDMAKLDSKRNKVAIKVQKVKDKVIPKLRKKAKEILSDEYDDIEKAEVIDGEVVIKVFNHLAEWKESFKNKYKTK